MSLHQRRGMVVDGCGMSINRQCRLLGIYKSGLYYKVAPTNPEDLEIMKRIDFWHLQDPTLGTRRMVKYLAREGYYIGRDKTRRLMQQMRIKTVYCRPKTTLADKTKYKYPYLLRGLKVTHPNQVWAVDITYIPMQKGFMYMVALIDLYSRYIVVWDISNTMEASWVIQVVERAIHTHGIPEIINSDQGSQFTCENYINLLKGHGIQISMDGKGRAIDNIFIERFWRTLKHERIYLYPPMDGTSLFTTCQQFILYYNDERLHESIDYQSPKNQYRHAA